ncbi:MAG: YbhB/YbcL family Raf kinase inhibitor-like protein [Anaerolineae bacterium]
MTLQLTSTAFKQEEDIPAQYTCDGVGYSPPLRWAQTPDGTKSLTLILEDPDAGQGVFTHWLIYNIPANTRSFDEGMPVAPRLPDGTLQGLNSRRSVGYTGPCPPGSSHRYFFRLYALDEMLDVPAGSNKQDLLAAMEGHILGQAELMGRYSRKR